MLRKTVFAAAVLLAVAAQAQNVTITGAENATLRDLLNSPTLVTVVLDMEGNPEDQNIRIIELQSTYFSGVKPDGEKVTYLYADMKELRVQGGTVEQADFAALRKGSLSREQLDVVDTAWKRSEKLYAGANPNQSLKISVAALLAMRGDESVLTYLRRLTESNDLDAQFDAAIALYLAGKPVPEGLLRAGFESGRLDIRGRAAKLAGLTGDTSARPFLDVLLRDRSSELSAPAAVAFARLGDRSVIPKLVSMLTEVNEVKGEAALKALLILGGDDVVAELKMHLETTEGNRQFRVMRTLHLLGAPEGTKRLALVLKNDPISAPEAAKLLAASRDWAAAQYLRERLGRRMDPTEHNEMNHVRDAAALIAGGDTDATAELQNMLGSEFVRVKMLVCDKIAELQKQNLITLLRPGIGNVSPPVAHHASTAAITFAEPEFRDRLFSVGLMR